MSVKWIGDAARDLGLDVFDAIELLASKQNYPMNGLLDEDRMGLLRRYRERGLDSSGRLSIPPPPGFSGPQPAVTSPPPIPTPPPIPPGPTTLKRQSDDEVTSPYSVDATAKGDAAAPKKDKAEERTVILTPFKPPA